jgi:hypothetical protein
MQKGRIVGRFGQRMDKQRLGIGQFVPPEMRHGPRDHGRPIIGKRWDGGVHAPRPLMARPQGHNRAASYMPAGFEAESAL